MLRQLMSCCVAVFFYRLLILLGVGIVTATFVLAVSVVYLFFVCFLCVAQKVGSNDMLIWLMCSMAQTSSRVTQNAVKVYIQILTLIPND